jgi:hypothetical protein
MLRRHTQLGVELGNFCDTWLPECKKLRPPSPHSNFAVVDHQMSHCCTLGNWAIQTCRRSQQVHVHVKPIPTFDEEL